LNTNNIAVRCTFNYAFLVLITNILQRCCYANMLKVQRTDIFVKKLQPHEKVQRTVILFII